MINKLRFLLILICVVTLDLLGQVDNSLADKPVQFSDNAFGVNFFLGQGIYVGNISNYFSNPFYVGLNLEYYKNRFVIQFDDFIGLGKTKKTISYSNSDSWGDNKFALSGMINLSFGYCLIDNNILMFAPVVGLGFNKLSSNTDELYDFSNKFKPVLPHLKIGSYIDLKHFRLNSKNSEDSYACPRLSFGINIPISNNKYDQFYDGKQIYITLGFGGLGKIN